MLQTLAACLAYAQSDRLYEAFKDGKSGLIDIKGNWVVKPRFDSIDYVEYHRIYFYKDSLMGIANMSGKTLVKPRWKELMGDEYGLAMARDEKGSTYIRTNNGKPICGYYKDVDFFDEGHVFVQDSNDKWGAIDQYGGRLIPCLYDALDDMGEGNTRAWLNGKSILIDKDGKHQESSDVDVPRRATYRQQTFRKDGKWGYVNGKGDTVLRPVYDYLACSYGGNACTFCKDGKCGVADTLGQVIIAPKYDQLRSFYPQNVTWLNEACLNGKWGLINGKEEVIVPFEYEAIHELHPGFFAASIGGKWGILNGEGAWELTPRFERIREAFWDDDDDDDDEYSSRTSTPLRCGFSLGYRTPQRTDAKSEVAIKVFPNPTKGRFAIELPEGHPSSYRLYDSKGAIVQSGTLSERVTEADISSLPPAAYTLMVYYDEQAVNFRVTKQ
jgi:hypothetical protein